MATVTLDPIPVLKALKAAGSATAAQVGTTRAFLRELDKDGLVVEVGFHKTGKRGRPAVTYKVTKKGSDKIRRAA